MLSQGSFSIEEIDSIIEQLNSRYGDAEFIQLVVTQLLEFRRKICINRGLTNEDDPLSPKSFINMSIREIEEAVIKDKEAYFALAEEQFQESTRVGISNKDFKSFRIEQTDN